MNTEYVLWFATLVVVAGAALLWLAIGDVPEIPTDPDVQATPDAGRPEEVPSETAGEDGLAGSA